MLSKKLYPALLAAKVNGGANEVASTIPELSAPNLLADGPVTRKLTSLLGSSPSAARIIFKDKIEGPAKLLTAIFLPLSCEASLISFRVINTCGSWLIGLAIIK